jgi:hypothetical protein
MKRKSIIARYSLSEVEAVRKSGEDPTRPDAPEAEALPKDFWKSARVVMPSGKTSTYLRLDRNILGRFNARTGSKLAERATRPA